MWLLVAQARILEGLAYRSLGEKDKALAAYEVARKHFDEAGERRGKARTLNNIAIVLATKGDLQGAKTMFEEGLEVFEAIGDMKNVAASLNNLAIVDKWMGDEESVKSRYERAIAINRTIDNKPALASMLHNLANFQYDHGDLKEAKKNYLEIESLTSEIGNRSLRAHALFGLGEIHVVQHDFRKARAYHEESLGIRTEIGETDGEVTSRLALANISIETGNPLDAVETARKAIDFFKESNTPYSLIYAFTILAKARLAGGEAEAAREAIEKGEGLLKEGDRHEIRFVVAILKARINAALGLHGPALTSLHTVVEETTKARLIHHTLEACLALGEIELAAGHRKEGLLRLERLEEEARLKGFHRIAIRARTLRGEA